MKYMRYYSHNIIADKIYMRYQIINQNYLENYKNKSEKYLRYSEKYLINKYLY